jgi:hypothetical protein
MNKRSCRVSKRVAKSHSKRASGGEFATSMRIRWIGSISDGRETSRSVTAGDLSGLRWQHNHNEPAVRCRQPSRVTG